jgi:hypothetical protein
LHMMKIGHQSMISRIRNSGTCRHFLAVFRGLLRMFLGGVLLHVLGSLLRVLFEVATLPLGNSFFSALHLFFPRRTISSGMIRMPPREIVSENRPR